MGDPEEATQESTTEESMAEEIKSMLAAGGFPDEEITEKPSEEEPEPESEVEEEPEPEPEEEEPEEEEEPPQQDQSLAELKAELAEMRQLLKEAVAQKKEPETPADPEVTDFVGDADLDEVLSTKEGINQLLNKVYQMGQEASMKRIPGVVQSSVDYYTEMKSATQQFYSDNPDLAGMKKAVTQIASEVLSDNPALQRDLPKMFKEIEKETRQRLGLPKKKSETPRAKQNDPGFARPRGRTAKPSPKAEEKDNLTPEQEEILNMNRALKGVPR